MVNGGATGRSAGGARRGVARSAIRRLLLIAVLLLLPVEALGHGVLRRSVPEEGARLTEAPRELRLGFNERIDLEFARIVLVGPEGESVRLDTPGHDEDSTHVVLVGL